ncbi:MAG: esterase [Phenylobacterium sp.]|nr:esterase [Phenylobacterium sp.]
MSTKHLVHPELQPLLDAFPKLVITAERLPLLRQGWPAAPAPEVPEVEVAERRVPGPPGAPEVRILVYTPLDAARPAPAILHIHGGGYVLGQPEGSDLDNRLLAKALGCLIVSVDYRLAPETPFPGPLEDCYAALSWLHGAASELGVDPTRFAIKGESAGGGLAAGLALLARDRGEVPVAFQLLTYPMIDDRPPADPHPHTGEFIWTDESNAYGWTAYLGHERGREGLSPYAAAARAEDLSGLPATFIATGALDLFLEENLEFARRLTRAGAPTELHVYPGAYHGFPMAAGSGPVRRYARDVLEALAEAFRPH